MLSKRTVATAGIAASALIGYYLIRRYQKSVAEAKNKAKQARKDALGGDAVVLIEDRAGTKPSINQCLELSACELAMVKISLFMHGASRVGFVVSVSGGVTSAQLRAGCAAIQAAHPALRSTVAAVGEGKPTVDSNFVLKVTEGVRLPVFEHVITNGGVDDLGEAAWWPVWTEIEKVHHCFLASTYFTFCFNSRAYWY